MIDGIFLCLYLQNVFSAQCYWLPPPRRDVVANKGCGGHVDASFAGYDIYSQKSSKLLEDQAFIIIDNSRCRPHSVVYY
jgi:hypothetical protein